MKAPTVEQARAACELWATEQGVGLVWPGDPIREAIMYAMAAYHGITGTGWDLATARSSLSVTLPGAGSEVMGLLRDIPYVGPLLALAAQKVEHPFICLAPSAMKDGLSMVAVMAHEMGHVGSIRAGGLGWCIAYGLAPEARAAGEAPCYGAGMAVKVRMGGLTTGECVTHALGALDRYGLDKEAKELAEGILWSNAASLDAGADPGGIVAEVETYLRRAGWTP